MNIERPHMGTAWESGWDDRFKGVANELLHQQRFRSRRGQAPDGHSDFASNDYLALRSHPQVLAAVQQAVEEYGWGSGASPVVNGHTPIHARLERALSEHCHSDDALLFSSGYAGNVGTLSSLATEDVLVCSDQLNHASLIDGLRLGRAARFVYPHLDNEGLRRYLSENRHRWGRCLIVTESVFSMDGDCANLRELMELATQYGCGVIVDEAHATGVYGARGGGCLELLGLDWSGSESPLLFKLGTLSKALGGIGGFVAGSAPGIDYLVNRGRSYLFSTSPPPAVAAGALAALQLLPDMSAHRLLLQNRSRLLRQCLRASGWNVPEGDSPIVPVIIGSEAETLQISRSLAERGFSVPAIRPPTVPVDTCRLRISLSLAHTPEQLDGLCAALASCPRGAGSEAMK